MSEQIRSWTGNRAQVIGMPPSVATRTDLATLVGLVFAAVKLA